MWHRNFLSHRQIDALFGDRVPSLDSVTVTEVLFKFERIYFSAYLDCASDVFPSAWVSKGYDSLQFRFCVCPIGKVEMLGAPVSSTTAKIEFSDNWFSVRALNDSWGIEAAARLELAFAEPFQDPGPGHDHDWFSPTFR